MKTKPAEFSTVALPDGIVIGGPWPDTIIAWPGGKGRRATKPEYDLFQALEQEHARAEMLAAALEESVKLQTHYAKLLNMHDGGKRIGFEVAAAWIARLRETGTLP